MKGSPVGKIIAALVVTGLVVAGFGALRREWQRANHTDDTALAAAELPTRLAQYRSLGLPWKAEDQAAEKLDDAENAGTYLRAADNRLNAILPPKAKTDPYGSGTKLGKSNRWAYEDRDFDPVFRFLYVAAQQKELSYLDRQSDSFGPSLTTDRMAVSLLIYRGQEALQRGDVDLAAQQFNTAQKLDVLMSNQSSTFNEMTAVRLQNQLLHAYEAALAALYPNPSAFDRFVHQFRPTEIKIDFVNNLKREMLADIEEVRTTEAPPFYLRLIKQGVNVNTTFAPPEISPDGIPVAVDDQAYLDRLIQFWVETYPKAMRAKNLTEVGRIIDDTQARYSHDDHDSYLRLSVIYSPKSATYSQFDLINEKVRLENFLTQAVLYRRSHGVWPTPEALFGPKPNPLYQMLVTPTGLTLYSKMPTPADVKENTQKFLAQSFHGTLSGVTDLVASFPPAKGANPELPF